MYSLNVPVPPAVRALADDLFPHLVGAEAVREALTLVVKRLGDPDPAEWPAREKQVRRALAGAPAVEARVSDVGVFERPPSGRAPVVYLAVESPGLAQLHRRLCEVVDPVPGIEGDAYVPHVTLARGGDVDVAALRGRVVDPVTWTVEELVFYDARHGERAGRVRLPA